MIVAAENSSRFLPGRFGFLMGLYAENHQRLARLFGPQRLAAGSYVSVVGDGLDVHLCVQERHPYTLEMQLTYDIVDGYGGLPEPSMQLRVYSDARLTEALHCHPGRHLWEILGPFPPARSVLQYRLRMNSFLSRWLEYLREQGHGVATLSSATPSSLSES